VNHHGVRRGIEDLAVVALTARQRGFGRRAIRHIDRRAHDVRLTAQVDQDAGAIDSNLPAGMPHGTFKCHLIAGQHSPHGRSDTFAIPGNQDVERIEIPHVLVAQAKQPLVAAVPQHEVASVVEDVGKAGQPPKQRIHELAWLRRRLNVVHPGHTSQCTGVCV